MMHLVLALLFQDAVSGIILSDDPDPPSPEIQRPAADLPAHALNDPFGWERSHCSPYLRKDEPLDVCQVRVRSDLQSVLGDQLPEGLKPTAGLENCNPGTAANGFQIECKPRQMTFPTTPQLHDRHCENRPERLNDGRIIVAEVCRPTHGDARPEALVLPLTRRD